MKRVLYDETSVKTAGVEDALFAMFCEALSQVSSEFDAFGGGTFPRFECAARGNIRQTGHRLTLTITGEPPTSAEIIRRTAGNN
jgi:hypothetical protein